MAIRDAMQECFKRLLRFLDLELNFHLKTVHGSYGRRDREAPRTDPRQSHKN